MAGEGKGQNIKIVQEKSVVDHRSLAFAEIDYILTWGL
jgi:hypothetical protein